MEPVTAAIQEFLTWWLALFGVADPAYVKFGMAAIAGIALLAAIGVVFGIIGTLLDAMKG
jgi:hypothetical protein